MKSILLSFGIGLICSVAVAQDSIPARVQSALYAFHPTTEDVFWESREGALVATFPHPAGLTKVFFNEEGQWLETRVRKSVHVLPKGVAQFIQEHYKDADITYAGEVQKPEGVPVYRIESELPSEVVVKILSKRGELLEEQRIPFHLPRFYVPALQPLPGKDITTGTPGDL